MAAIPIETSSPLQAAEKIRWLVGFQFPELDLTAADTLYSVWGMTNSDKPPLRIDGWTNAPGGMV